MRKSSLFYYDSNSLIVVNPSGEIKQIYTPFLAKCTQGSEIIHKNSMVYVEQIFEDPTHKMVYLIGSRLYAFSNFSIIIDY
jgi:hypothetical protein